MSEVFSIVVFTDLDGTLLDHDNYSWKAAEVALNKLNLMQIPLILNSSKTLAELSLIAGELGLTSPLICENGSIVAVRDDQKKDGYEIHRFAKPYKEVTSVVDKLRQQYDFKFTGFHDMTIDDVVDHTCLDREAASKAIQREASEPLIWNDSSTKLKQFTQLLESSGLSLTRGGRFYHVMSPVNKGQAIKWLINYFLNKDNQHQIITIALGDSVNDLPMLESVDYPVLIKNNNSPVIDTSHLNNIIKTELPGPQGWNQAVQDLLEKIYEEI